MSIHLQLVSKCPNACTQIISDFYVANAFELEELAPTEEPLMCEICHTYLINTIREAPKQ
jgi:hypothetical protein